MKERLYILASKNCKRFYIGSSSNLAKRLTEHNTDKVVATRGKGPWQCVFNQEYENATIAKQAERWLKKMKSKVLIQRIVKDGKINHNVA